jgi:sugar phosphate isomerase/epimerase
MMGVQYGCCARYFLNTYKEDVEFAKSNSFSFLQLMYNKDGLLQKDVSLQAQEIRSTEYPAIIHACLDMNDIKVYRQELIETAKYLGHKEIVLHPICRSEVITNDTIYKLSEIVGDLLCKLQKEGIALYLENNSKLDPIFTTSREIEIMFKENKELEFVLDIAHMDDYKHLQEMVAIKYPKMLHITDRPLEDIHNHVPIGQGNIDFRYIFDNIMPGYSNKVIIEVFQSDEGIIETRDYIKRILDE